MHRLLSASPNAVTGSAAATSVDHVPSAVVMTSSRSKAQHQVGDPRRAGESGDVAARLNERRHQLEITGRKLVMQLFLTKFHRLTIFRKRSLLLTRFELTREQ